MNKVGKFIVIESNDEPMKNAVVDELFRRLRDYDIFFKRMSQVNKVVDRLEQIAKGEFGSNLDWMTSFMFSEAALLETVSSFNDFGLGKIVLSGKTVIIDQFDASIYIKFIPSSSGSTTLFNNINYKVLNQLNPTVRILLATSRANLKKDVAGDYVTKLGRYINYYLNLDKRGETVKTIHVSDETFHEACNHVERIIKETIFA